MPVGKVLEIVGNKAGLDPKNPQDRLTLLRWLNEAAPELYQQADLPGSLMEQVFKVNGDQTIALPSYVGQLRGLREYASHMPWHITKMQPRYYQFNWVDMWRTWRMENLRALKATVTNQSFGVLKVHEVEAEPLIVTLSGPTQYASCVNEIVTMNKTEKQTINVFLDYTAVKKNRVNTFDVILEDVDGKELTTIPNNELEAKYQIVDVSSCPWLPQNTSRYDNYIELLYKKKLPYLSEDGDEFPCFNCDYALANKMLQLWAEEQEKDDQALKYDAKATRTISRLHKDQNTAAEETANIAAHPHDTLFTRIGVGSQRRYQYGAGKRY